jgi:flagellar motor switch protein FliG
MPNTGPATGWADDRHHARHDDAAAEGGGDRAAPAAARRVPGVDKLSPAHQSVLARAMSGLGQIDRATLADIVGEFTGALDNLALIMPRGMHDALEILDPHISAMARDGLKADAEIGDGTDPWPRLAAMDVAQLRPILDEESAEICAILLSKLNVAKAAALLSDLPPDRAEVIAHAVSLTDTILPETALRIGEHLHAQIVAQPKATFETGPVERVGAMLNAVGTASRDAVLAGLDGRDADFAKGVRRAIFTFQHIPKRIDAADIPRITGAVDGETLVTALAYGLQAAPSRWNSSSRTCPAAWPNRCATRRRR